MANDYLIGTGIYDVTGPPTELGMMGKANIEQKTEGIQSRLYARTFIVCDQSSDKRVVILNADIWSCTQAVKMEVVKLLKAIYGHTLKYYSERLQKNTDNKETKICVIGHTQHPYINTDINESKKIYIDAGAWMAGRSDFVVITNEKVASASFSDNRIIIIF